MTQHADFTAATGIPVYFCDAYCRGSAAATRTATDCCGNTSRRKPTYPNTTPITSTPWSTAQQPTSTEPGMANSSRGPVGHRLCDDRRAWEPSAARRAGRGRPTSRSRLRRREDVDSDPAITSQVTSTACACASVLLCFRDHVASDSEPLVEPRVAFII
jgi:hypothetical protein